MKREVHLGFEVGTGEPVSIPLRHMVVTGQTQEAGKTTTLEALIARANLPAVAFVTKRGERSFGDGRRIAPYFRERADWQFVVSVLEATMRERLKFERAWIMRASKGAGGMEKEILRSCPVWLLGVQREANEIKRTLDNIPASTARPKPSDIATLQRGQFFACFGEHVIKTYVQPAWMVQAEAVGIARGTIRIEQVSSRPVAPPEESMSKTDEKLDKLIELLSHQQAPAPASGRGKRNDTGRRTWSTGCW